MGYSNFWRNQGIDGRDPEWDSAFPYTIDQVAWYGESWYYALLESTNAQPDLYPLSWKKIVTAPGTKWSDEAVYAIGDVVWYNNNFWKSLQADNENQIPAEDAYWTDSDILANTDLQAQITVHAGDIGDNVTDISTNVTNIGTNDDDILALQNGVAEILAGTAQAGIGSIHTFATYKDRTSAGLYAFDFDNPVSKAAYAPLWDEVQHSFNAQHVAAGDPDLVALDNGAFYPTPTPAGYGRSGIPDIGFTDADVDTVSNRIHNLASGINDSRRHGSAFRFIVDSGTIPATSPQLVSGDTYYLRFLGTPGDVSLYLTEADAVANTNLINITTTGSGTFRLTQEGIAIDHAFQGHEWNVRYGSPIISGANDILARSNNTSAILNDFRDMSITLTDDGVNGTPQISNETRPTTYYEFSYIKAEAILSSGETVSAEVYPWEELGRTVWQNQAININHGLSIDKRYLDIKVELKKTGTVDIWQESKQIMFDALTGVAFEVGIAINEVDDNNIEIITGKDGVALINPISGGLTLLQAVAGDIRVTITKPNLLANQLIVPDDVTINDAVHVTKTFPAISELIGTRTYTRSGTGTGKFTLNVPAGGVVDWGDAEVVDGSVVLEGVGKVVIRASGGKYKIDEYEDYITDGANQQIWKYKDGTEKQIILQSYIGVISVVAGVLFRTSSFALLTRYHDFLSLDNETVSIVSSTAPYVWAAIGTILSSITNPLRPHILSGIAYGSNTSIVSINSIGRWRA